MSSKHTDTDDVRFVYEEYINKNMVLSDCNIISNNDETDITRAPDFYQGKCYLTTFLISNKISF